MERDQHIFVDDVMNPGISRKSTWGDVESLDSSCDAHGWTLMRA